MSANAYREEISSQIPALQLLINLGWQYLTPDEALALRGGKEQQRRAHRRAGALAARAQRRSASRAGATPSATPTSGEALDRLVDEPLPEPDCSPTSGIYELLTLGTSLTQTIDGDRKSFSLHYIDWQHPEHNVYHVTDEFAVETRGQPRDPPARHRALRQRHPPGGHRVQAPRPGPPRREGRGRRRSARCCATSDEDEIPHLFVYSQLLLARQPQRRALRHHRHAQEVLGDLARGGDEATRRSSGSAPLINRPLADDVQDALYGWREYAPPSARALRRACGERLPTGAGPPALRPAAPERLLELAYQYIVFDGGIKKIARYQQYFAIRATMDRVAHRNAQGTAHRRRDLAHHRQRQVADHGDAGQGAGAAPEHQQPARRAGHRPRGPRRPDLGHLQGLRQVGGARPRTASTWCAW